MKRQLIVMMILLPIFMVSAQTLAQNYNVDNGYQAAQLYQEFGGELSKEKEEKILKTLSPEMRAKLEEIKKLSKEKYQQLLQSSYHADVFSTGFSQAEEVFGLKGFSEKYKKEKDLEVDVELLALKYKNADESSQPKLKNELAARLSDLFEMRETKKQEEVRKLEKRLQELKESLQARKQNKNEIVNRRIQELLGNSKYLRWE